MHRFDSPATEPYWDSRHPVLEILRRRRDSGSKPGARDDSATVGLAISGGGMRGAISAAMCTQLDDAGFKNAFDVVYGASSGAINAAYFVCQAPNTLWYPLSIYYDELATSKFVDYRRLLRGASILDLDFVFEELLRSRTPLHFPAAVDSPLTLAVAATDLDALKTVTFRGFKTARELETALRASTQLPLATNGVVEIDGKRLLDGALLTPMPFHLGVGDGCTHILSLSTHRMQKTSARVSIGHQLYAKGLERVARGLGTSYLSAVGQREHDRNWLTRQRFETSGDGPHVLDLAPLPWMEEIRMHDNRTRSVLDRIRDAYAVSHCATEGISTIRLRDGAVRAMPALTMAHSDLSRSLVHPLSSAQHRTSLRTIESAS
ncbi:patatin-like phospholipase family protein [Nocardia brasiliensis]